ncbi:MAG: methionine synthase, partial [Actinomycetota bacterium]|nr:methionine synthase [Actinomycetota bacterium]
MTRLLVTHAGSLPRPRPLVDALAGEAPDADLDVLVEESVAATIANQAAVGIDIASDGEQGRESFFTYVQHRMSGFGLGDGARRGFQDMNDFPGFLDLLRSQRSRRSQVSLARPPQAVGPVAYGDGGELIAELERFERLSSDAGFADRFVTAPSPGLIVTAMANRHYESDAEYLAAVAEALGVEYRAVIESGYLLQIDAPDLAMERHAAFRDRSLGDFLAFVDKVVAAINGATVGLDTSRIRLHVCWGNYEGPHTHDVDLADLLESLYRARV